MHGEPGLPGFDPIRPALEGGAIEPGSSVAEVSADTIAMTINNMLLTASVVLILGTSVFRLVRSRYGAEKFGPPTSRRKVMAFFVRRIVILVLVFLLLLAVWLFALPSEFAMVGCFLIVLNHCFFIWFFPPPKMIGPLFLIGPRGSGKTTVARLLAARLNVPWHDADAVLSARTGKTIRAIFQEEGEAAFRQYESAVLADLCRDTPAVIATGGGGVTVAANRELLKASGRVVWLTAEPETLWQRIQEDAATTGQRPALTALAGLDELRAVLAAREPWYRECAEFAIDTTGQTPEDVTQRILSRLAVA